MNLKKAVLSFFAAGSILAAGFGGAGAAETTGTVKVIDGGDAFDVYFCSEGIDLGDGVAFDDATVTSSGENVVTGDAVICYVDTTTYRGKYTTHIAADDFVGQEHGGVIPASELSLGHMSIMKSGQWSSGVPGVGSITALTSSGSITSHDGAEYGGNNNLSNSLHIHNVWPGAGTGGSFYLTVEDGDGNPAYTEDERSDQGSWQEVEFRLRVPGGTRADVYESDITLNLSPDGP